MASQRSISHHIILVPIYLVAEVLQDSIIIFHQPAVPAIKLLTRLTKIMILIAMFKELTC